MSKEITVRQLPNFINGKFVETGNTPAFTQAIGATALNVNRADPRFGYDLPASVTGLAARALTLRLFSVASGFFTRSLPQVTFCSL